MGPPTRYVHCQGRRCTEEALLVPGCLKPAKKGEPLLLHLLSAGHPLAAEGIAMTSQVQGLKVTNQKTLETCSCA